MPNHRRVPDWEYGDILTNDHPSNLAVDHTTKAMFIAWEYTDDYNPTESIPVLLVLDHGAWIDVSSGQVLHPYCGWWTEVPDNGD